MSWKQSASGFVIVAGLVSLAPLVRGGDSLLPSGQILGEVRNSTGVVQMGARVLLFNRYEQLIGRALTNEQGKFAFDAVTPDSYSIQVALASFVTARRSISVLAGSENVLKIHLSSLLSAIGFVSSAPSQGTLMSDEWKWVLRSSPSTRPVLRLTPAPSSSKTSLASMFSETTGVVRVSTGDSDLFSGSLQQDVGTAFAL